VERGGELVQAVQPGVDYRVCGRQPDHLFVRSWRHPEHRVIFTTHAKSSAVTTRLLACCWTHRPSLSDLDRFSENLQLNKGRVRDMKYLKRSWPSRLPNACPLCHVCYVPQLSFWVKRWCQENSINVANSGIDDNAFRGNNFACAISSRFLFCDLPAAEMKHVPRLAMRF